jgi:hypothetical protein
MARLRWDLLCPRRGAGGRRLDGLETAVLPAGMRQGAAVPPPGLERRPRAKKLCCHWNRAQRQLVEEAGLEVSSARRGFFGIFHRIEAAPEKMSGVASA